MNAPAPQTRSLRTASQKIRPAIRKGAILCLATAIGLISASSPAVATPPPAKTQTINPGEGTTVQGEPELADCGTVYALRHDRPHNVERIDPETGDSRILFTMGDDAKWLNGLGLDRNTQTFWAVQQDGTGGNRVTRTPKVYSYDTRSNTASTYTGTEILTPLPRESMVGGAFNPNTNIFYYGQLSNGSFYVYGFDAAAERAIPGIISIIDVGQATNGDFAFDSTGRLYIAADGMLLVTQDPLPTTGSSTPPRVKARGIAKLSDVPLGSGAFGSDGKLYLATGSGTILTVDPSSGETEHISRLQKSSNLVSDFASCSPPRTLTLAKDLPSGRVTDTDQFTLSIDGGGLADGNRGTTTGSASGLQNVGFDDYAGPVAVKPGVTYTLSELGAGDTQSSSYDARWSCSLGGDIFAQGTGTSGSVTIPLSPAAGTDMSCQFTNTPRLDVSAEKTAVPASGTPVNANDTITYTLSFTNASQLPKDVAAHDDLSKVLNNATLVSAPHASSDALTAALEDGVITVNGTLPASSSATVSYTVRVNHKADRASSTIENSLDACDSPEHCTTAHPIRELSVAKAATSDVGGISYVVTVTNSGNVAYTAENPATMTDDLTELERLGARYRGDVAASSGDAVVTDNVLRWSGALGIGESATISYSFSSVGVSETARLPNEACVPLAGEDPECVAVITPARLPRGPHRPARGQIATC